MFSRRYVGPLVIAVLVVATLLAIGWQGVLATLGGLLVDAERPERADLILVLGGDFWGPRVIEAAELGRHGYAPVVLISSPPYAGRPEGELAVEFLVKRGYRREMFAVFPHNATSTVAEANAVRGELERRGVHRVLLVTSNYHSRRAAIVFRLFCGGIRFISVPAADPNYPADRWWKGEGSRNVFYSEWVKIAGSLLIAYPRYLVSRL